MSRKSPQIQLSVPLTFSTSRQLEVEYLEPRRMIYQRFLTCTFFESVILVQSNTLVHVHVHE